MGDYSVIVYWQRADGSQVKVQSKASRMTSLQADISSRGGTITKVTRVGGGRVTKPRVTTTSTGEKVTIPATMEDKVLYEAEKVEATEQRAIKTTPSTALEYLIKYAEPEESKRLEVIIQDTKLPREFREKAFQKAAEDAHKSLTEEEKQEYGYHYTEWETIPVGERIGYYGYDLYYQSLPIEERQKEIKEFTTSPEFYEYKKSKRGIEEIKLIAMGLHTEKVTEPDTYKFSIPLVGTWDTGIKQPKELSQFNISTVSVIDYEKAQQQAAQNILEGKTAYETLPFRVRAGRSFAESAVQAVAWPVTLPQMLVKAINKGETVFLPDVAKAIGEVRTAPTQGIFSGTISTVLGDTSYMETAKKYTWETAFAGLGEIVGLRLGTKAIYEPLKTGVKTSVKTGIKYTPRIKSFFVDKIKTRTTFLGQTESGKILFRITKEKPLTQKLFDFGEKIQHTRTMQNARKIISGESVWARQLPQKSMKILPEEGYGWFARITKYAGRGKRVLVSKTDLQRAIEKIGTREGIVWMRGQRGLLEYSFDYTMVTKPKGFIFKRITEKYASFRMGENIHRLIGKGNEGTFFQKPLQLPYIGMKKIVRKLTFKEADDAMASLVGQQRTMAYGSLGGKMHGTGYVGKTIIIPETSLLTSPYVGYGLATASLLNQQQLLQQQSLLEYKQDLVSIQLPQSIQQRMPQTDQMNLPTFESVQLTEQTSDQIQAQVYDMITELEQPQQSITSVSMRRIKLPRQKVPKVKIPKVPFVLPDSNRLEKQIRLTSRKDLSTGFRIKKWNVKPIERLIKGGK